MSFEKGSGAGNRESIALTRQLWSQQDFNKSIGVLAVLVEKEYLGNMLLSSHDDQMLWLETGQGEVLAANVPQEQLIRIPVQEFGINDREFGEQHLDGKRYLQRSAQIGENDVFLVSLIPQASVSGLSYRNFPKLAVLYLLVTVSILLLLFLLIHTVTRRIQLVGNRMKEVQDGKLQVIEEALLYEDELGELMENYNRMVRRIDGLLQEQYELGQEKNSAQLKALQSQINPHFLYNTLDMVNWMAQKGETENIRSVIQAMSLFYRLTLSGGRDIVSIGDEVKMCCAYMEIQKKRFQGLLQFEVRIEPEIEKYLIPKITLLPFLENAVLHGIQEKEDERGTVKLTGFGEEDEIILSVTDDGVGMRDQIPRKESGGSHYGLKNIEERLSLFFGKEISVQVESAPGIGTCVMICIPKREDEKPGCGR